MDLLDNGRASPFHSQNDHVSDVSQENTLDAITQKREHLNHIERKIEGLVEMKREVEEDLIRLSVAHAHRNHANRLPNEVLSRVFILVAHPPKKSSSTACFIACVFTLAKSGTPNIRAVGQYVALLLVAGQECYSSSSAMAPTSWNISSYNVDTLR